MIPAETRSQKSEVRSRILPTRFPLTILALAIGLSLLASGCRRPPPTFKPNETTTAKGDPWDAAAKRLRKDTDLVASKVVLGTLTTDLGRAEKVDKPAALSREAEEALAKLVPLNASD